MCLPSSPSPLAMVRSLGLHGRSPLPAAATAEAASLHFWGPEGRCPRIESLLQLPLAPHPPAACRRVAGGDQQPARVGAAGLQGHEGAQPHPVARV